MKTLGFLDGRKAADRYASGLRAGDEIIEDTDAETIAPFRHHLPAALARRGFVAVETMPEQRWVIREVPRPNPPIARAHCHCGRAWFDCDHLGELSVPEEW